VKTKALPKKKKKKGEGRVSAKTGPKKYKV
jgi:hypothetical protein